MSLSDLFPRQATTRDLKILEKRLAEKSRSARKRRVNINKRIDELEEELARMTLLCRTLSDVIVEKGMIDLPELFERMNQIDLEDGVADGQVTPKRKRPKPAKTKKKRAKVSYRSKKKGAPRPRRKKGGMK